MSETYKALAVFNRKKALDCVDQMTDIMNNNGSVAAVEHLLELAKHYYAEAHKYDKEAAQ